MPDSKTIKKRRNWTYCKYIQYIIYTRSIHLKLFCVLYADDGSHRFVAERRRWTEVEKNAVFSNFQKDFYEKKTPSVADCFKIIKTCSQLKDRSAMQLKLFIHKQLSKKTK